MARDHAQVVIVGAGAAGSVFAAVLAEAGRDVRVLESGPPRRLSDLYSSQIWGRRLKWAEPHVAEATRDSVWFNLNAGRGYGGAATHHFAVWPRYHADDFKLHSSFGKGLDWPIEYADLQPWYDRVQEEVGIAGDAEAEVWRPPGAPYPLPPVPRFVQGQVLARGFEAAGLRVAPIPVAVLTRPYKGRPACIWDGWCEAGCPTGALANPLATYLPRATAAGAKLQAGCHVTRVLTDAKGQRAIGVEYVDTAGARHELAADVVVLAAFGVENVRLLLNSATTAHAAGLANSSGMVGRYLTSHPSVMTFGLFDADLQNHMGLSGGQIFSHEHWTKTGRPGAFGSRQYEAAMAIKPNDLLGIAMTRAELFHRDLERFMQRAVRGLGQMTAVCEDQPIAANRIEPDSRRDAHGLPLARIHYTTSPDGMGLWHAAVADSERIMKAAGAMEVWHGPKVAQHIMGGTIMGSDPAASVTDSYGRTHDVGNLFVAGGGLFPTTSAVNSTYTIHALALRAAVHLRDGWAGLTR
ncbi:MAG: GMC family oxidoreductase [Gammaproteobacteria bacterium]|nr:GMC family oxidoreductase [Gammaproteobacteria bacterium]